MAEKPRLVIEGLDDDLKQKFYKPLLGLMSRLMIDPVELENYAISAPNGPSDELRWP